MRQNRNLFIFTNRGVFVFDLSVRQNSFDDVVILNHMTNIEAPSPRTKNPSTSRKCITPKVKGSSRKVIDFHVDRAQKCDELKIQDKHNPKKKIIYACRINTERSARQGIDLRIITKASNELSGLHVKTKKGDYFELCKNPS